MPNFRGDHATLRHARLSTTARLETGTRIRVEYSAGHTGDAPDGIHRPEVADDARGTSIVDNIVEGCGAASRLEFARYVDISIKSTSEVDYQLELARDLGVMSHDVWKPLAKEVIELRKMLSALRRSVLAAAARDKTLRPPKQASRKPRRNVSTKRPSELTPEDAGTDD
jgi:23S rRNA-intervening sequence protein